MSLLVGVQNAAPEFQFTAFPNPNGGKFQCILKSAIPLDFKISVYDGFGKLVDSFQGAAITAFEQKVDLSGQSKGIYFLHLEAGEIHRTIKLVVTVE